MLGLDEDGLSYVLPFQRLSNAQRGGGSPERAERDEFERIAETLKKRTPQRPESPKALGIFAKWRWAALRLSGAATRRGFWDGVTIDLTPAGGPSIGRK